MGVTTWDGSSSTDWGTAANWDTGSVPTGSTHVVIPDTSSINNCVLDTNRTVESFRIDANGTFDGDGNTLTIDNEGDATTGASELYAVRISGIISGTDTDIQVTTPAATKLDLNASSGNIRNLTINHASCDAQLQAAASITGNLTITAGELDTTSSNHALTVTGTIDVDGGNLNVNDSAVSCAKLIVESGDTITAAHSSNALTVTGAGIGNNRSIDFTGAISGTLDIITTHSGTREDDLSASSGTVNHLTVNHASAVMRMNASYTVGNLTITAGQFTTADAGGNSKALTVTGQINIASGATLNCNASTITNGSASSPASDFDPAGNLTLGSCTFKFYCGSSGNVYLSDATLAANTSTLELIGMQTFSNRDMGLSASSGNLHNLTVTKTGSVTSGFRLTHDTTLGGNLTIETGATLDTNTSDKDLTVTGSTSVSGTLTCNASTVSLGSAKTDGYGLNVASGGTFTGGSGTHTIGSCNLQSSTTFTSGTTTINGVGGGSNYAFWMDTNFTHGGGTIAFTRNGDQLLGESGTDTPTRTFNNLTINKAGGEVKFVEDNAINCVVAGDLTITAGEFDTGADNVALTVTGDVRVTGTLTGNASAISMGSLTIASGGTYLATSGTTTITSENGSGFAIQNSGTFTHNNGLVDIDLDTPVTTQASNGPYYDFTQSDAATDFYPAEAFEVMNNLSFVGDFEFQNNAHHLTVHGNMTIGDGTTTTRYMPYHTRTCNLTVGGILEVTNGATLTNFTHGTINVGGVRNTGGTM